MAMFRWIAAHWRGEWKRFAAEEPGRRFLRRYEAHRGAGAWWAKGLRIAGGVLLFAVGPFFAVAPGPAILFFIPGALLIARESRGAARAMDGLDRLSAPARHALGKRWRRFSPKTRRVLGGLLVASGAATLVASVVVLKLRG